LSRCLFYLSFFAVQNKSPAESVGLPFRTGGL
jgi:hypothetical protein